MVGFLKPASLLAGLLISTTSALPSRGNRSPSLKTIFQFPQLHWIENLAIRGNGQILATDLGQRQIYLVDPKKPGVEPKVIYKFQNITSPNGIAEVEDDVFYAGSADGDVFTLTFQPGTSAIWRIDMRSYARTGQADVQKLVDISTARQLNGATLLNRRKGLLLLSDSAQGVIYRLNVKTKEYEIVIDDPLLKPNVTGFIRYGSNGVRVVGKTLYISNTNFGRLLKVDVDTNTGKPTGPLQLISDQLPAMDDFAINPRDGSAWVARNTDNVLSRVFRDGKIETVVGGGNSTDLLGPTSVEYGRTRRDEDTLYITTTGLVLDPTTGAPLATNGKIASLDTRDC